MEAHDRDGSPRPSTGPGRVWVSVAMFRGVVFSAVILVGIGHVGKVCHRRLPCRRGPRLAVSLTCRCRLRVMTT